MPRLSNVIFGVFIIFVTLFSLAAEVQVHWILVSYHKTGHALTRKMILPFAYYSRAALYEYKMGDFRPIEEVMGEILKSPMIYMHGKDMLYDWNKMFGNIPGHEFKIVQFLRDPYEMVNSGYTYHSLIPMIEDTRVINCSHLFGESHRKYVSIIESFNEEKESGQPLSNQGSNLNPNLNVQLQDSGGRPSGHFTLDILQEECSRITDYYGLSRFKYHTDALNHISKMHNERYHIDGVRFEAIRAASHHLLMMGANTVRSLDADSSMVMTVTMEDFPTNNATVIYNSVKRMVRFLVNHSSAVHNPFYSPMLSMNIAEEIRSAWVHPQFSHKSPHITHSFSPVEVRDSWTHQIQCDSHFSTMMDAIADVVRYARFNRSAQAGLLRYNYLPYNSIGHITESGLNCSVSM